MRRLPDHSITVDNVSSHAVTRYVQRVLGVVLPIDEVVVGGREAAHQHCQAVGMTVNEIKLLILCPEVRGALALGAAAVRTTRFKAVLNYVQRLVVTIEHRTHTPGYLAPKRYTEPSRIEARRTAQQFSRRGRGRHKNRPAT